jgi:raffinose/stachyose/melibiose transport system permease protein
MALFSVFIVLPMVGAVALSLFRWNGLGTPHWAGAANWVQFAHDPLARQALTVTAKVVVLSWVVQTPISIALGLFTADTRWPAAPRPLPGGAAGSLPAG